MKMKLVPSLGLLVATALPALSQDAQPAAAPAAPETVIVAPAAAPAPAASRVAVVEEDGSNLGQIQKLAKAGVGDEVILAYVKNSRSLYNLSADDILKLKDSGLSSQVITAVLNHDNAIKAAMPRPAVAPAPAPPAEAPAVATAPAPAPAVTVVAAPTPPPPQIEVVPMSPGPDYDWVGGYWSWRGGAWVWMRGNWVVRPGVRIYVGPGARYRWRHW